MASTEEVLEHIRAHGGFVSPHVAPSPEGGTISFPGMTLKEYMLTTLTAAYIQACGRSHSAEKIGDEAIKLTAKLLSHLEKDMLK